MTRARFLYLLLAATAMAASAAGCYLTLINHAPFGSWQLTSIGLAVPAALTSLVIAWHLPHNRVAQVFMAAGLLFAMDLLCIGVLQAPAAGRPAQELAYAALVVGGGPATVSWILFILLFPDGRFTRPLWAGFGVAASLVSVTASSLQWLLAPPGFVPDEFAVTMSRALHGPLAQGPGVLPLLQVLSLQGVVLPILAVAALVDRYRRGSTTVRQQTKWVLYAVAFEVLVQTAIFGSGRLGLALPPALVLLGTPWTFVAATIAVLRYRLWEIDRLVVRTVAFGLLWALSTGALVWLAIVAGVAVSGADRRLYLALAAAVLVTLIVQPLRRRLEGLISHLVYGEAPRGYGALAALERDVPPGDLSRLVAETAREAVGAPWAAVWLQVDSEGRKLLNLSAVAGSAPQVESLAAVVGGSLGDLIAALPERAGAAAVLHDGAEQVGVVVCGRRDGAEPVSDDQELLDLIAGQSALLLRNARLEEELRQRLQELRDSRQRLVGAQDEERRRLERDLHDGVQAQLVTLVAKLRQARPDDLERLVSEAEEAVFALQDLARGIYPSVLSDSGLAEALRTQAARVPLDVRVEVEPALAGARYDREVEAGLYFVALEALTNAQKHAGGAAVTIALRTSEAGTGLVLEVHDDGRGFDASGRGGDGTGIQNMRDRVAALGGSLAVESRPGSGTWIHALVPVAARVVPIQAPGRISRR